ncbi:MAG: rRNA pseudouridine synthase [Burkholderiales bacterium]|jgi:23S rRNA pseudouridine2604 synthase|nr:rRNA pseudouridine synthase [Burkholderiales bacterium]
MASPKKTLRLPSGKRSVRSETAAMPKPPRSHKPWSQALAKKRSPRIVAETTSAKDSPPRSRAFSDSSYTEKRAEERKSVASPDRRAPPRWRSSGKDNSPEFRASQQRRSSGGERFGTDSRNTTSRDTTFRDATSRGASSRRSSGVLREERPIKNTPRDEKTWRGRSESDRSENNRLENRPRYEGKVSRHREDVKTENTGVGRAKTFTKKTSSSSPPEGVRVSKLLASRGLCSRREADEYIERGWVRVNGQRVALGARAQPDDDITLLPQAKKQQAHRVTILLHKPIGYVSGQPEPGYKPAITLITPENQWQQEGDPSFSALHLRHLVPAGRLDIDSTGLLILTQDGRVARNLIGETSSIDKEYLVRVEGALSDANLALLRHGLSLDGEALKPARVEWINDDQLRFVLREGKKRQIRRMCEAVGLTVTGLKRVRIGQVRLGDLPLGQWRYLRDGESFDSFER